MMFDHFSGKLLARGNLFEQDFVTFYRISYQFFIALQEVSSLVQLESLDMRIYIKAIKAVFQEIAVVFSPQQLQAI